MKRQIKVLTMAVGLMLACGSVFADTNVAVVDVSAVVTKSSQVKSLKAEQQKKLQELQTWLNTVRADIQKQSTKEGKDKLTKKYDAEFVKKQEAIRKDYSKKLQDIDKNITSVIAKEAQTKGYNVVLSKNSVLYGGADITDSIIKIVK